MYEGVYMSQVQFLPHQHTIYMPAHPRLFALSLISHHLSLR
jgi:hypothetical protein